MSTVGSRIRNRREELRLSQQEVADKIGVSQPAYNRYEQDKIHRFSKNVLEKLAVALETTPEYVLGTEDRDSKLEHMPDYLQKFVLDPANLEFIAKAYLESQQAKLSTLIGKKIGE